MSSNATQPADAPPPASPVPLPVLVGLRGIGQVFFQENALTGALFLLGIALSSPLMAVGAAVGTAIGAGLAWAMKFDRKEIDAGIYGFNPTLVGIASFFFFQPGAVSIGLMLVGCVVATLLTFAMRKYVPFPTYTTPFIVTTWGVFFLCKALGAAAADNSFPTLVPDPPLDFTLAAVSHGIGQVMFQGSFWTGVLFLAGIAISDRQHAGWVLAGSILGMLVAAYHVTAATKAIDPDWLIERPQFELIKLGLYGFNATLVPVALFLWRRSLIAPLLGIVLTVPLMELIPQVGLPALTAPFVVAAWIVLGLGWLEERFLVEKPSPPT